MRRVLFCIVIMSFWVSKAQEKWVLDSKKSLIKYEASHFLHDWAGSNESVKGVLLENDGVFQKIALAMYLRDFDSKNSNRDNNALEILEVLKSRIEERNLFRSGRIHPPASSMRGLGTPTSKFT